MPIRSISLFLFIFCNIAIAFECQWMFSEKEGFYFYLLLVFLVLINPILIYFSLTTTKRRLISLVLILPVIFIHVLIKEYNEDYELDKYGQVTTGIVTDKKWSKKTRGADGSWLIRGKFKYDGNDYYTFFEKLESDTVNVNDSIPILFSTNNAKINHLIIE